MRKQPWAWYLVAGGIGLLLGYVDTHLQGDDNLPSVVMILIPAFVFGALQPRQAWRWGLLIGLGVPACHIGGLLIGYHPPYPVEPSVLITFIALIPAMIGAYFGALVRMLVARPASTS